MANFRAKVWERNEMQKAFVTMFSSVSSLQKKKEAERKELRELLIDKRGRRINMGIQSRQRTGGPGCRHTSIWLEKTLQCYSLGGRIDKK